MPKLVTAVCFLWSILFASCNNNSVYVSYKSLNGPWESGQKVEFAFQPLDTVNTHHMYINLRNDNSYKYSNLFLIVNMDFPNNETVTDTLEYEMAKPTGEWLGDGFSDVKENKLWYKEKVVFPVSGEYKITIEHAMRRNGEVNGIENLEGILDVGIEIEKAVK